MKFKVFFIKRKQIFYVILLILILIVFIIFNTLKNKENIPTFNVDFNTKEYTQDLTGDGKKDMLYITNSNNKYNVQITTEKNTFNIKPTKSIRTLGTYQPYWGIKVKFLDLNRDSIPEIFFQSSEKNKPIQHAYMYNNENFENIFSSNNNILGFLDCSNNKTPKLICGNLTKDNFNLSNYILIQNKLKKYNYVYEPNFVGKNTIVSFINFLTSGNTELSPSVESLFHPNIDSSSISTLVALLNSGTNYFFQDAEFIDIKSASDGNPSTLEWTLNFRGTSNTDKSSIKNYNIKLLMNKIKDSNDVECFKINSITQIQ